MRNRDSEPKSLSQSLQKCSLACSDGATQPKGASSNVLIAQRLILFYEKLYVTFLLELFPIAGICWLVSPHLHWLIIRNIGQLESSLTLHGERRFLRIRISLRKRLPAAINSPEADANLSDCFSSRRFYLLGFCSFSRSSVDWWCFFLKTGSPTNFHTLMRRPTCRVVVFSLHLPSTRLHAF